MIDEALYQRATDELNSDRRRPHLWARACALSSNDHDEARYLYTNLRVEELLAGRGTGDEAPDTPDAASVAAAPPDATEPGASDRDAAADEADASPGAQPGAWLDDTEPHSPFDNSPALEPALEPAPEPASASGFAPARDDDPGSETSDAAGRADVGALPDGARDDSVDARGPHPSGARDPMQFDLDTGEVDLDATEPVRADGLHDDLRRTTGVEDVFDPGTFDPDVDAGAHASRGDHAFARPAPAPTSGPRSGPVPGPAAAVASGVPVLRSHAGGRPGSDGGDTRNGTGAGMRLHDIDDQLDEVIGAGSGAGAAARRAFGNRIRNDYADPRDLDALLEDHRRPGASGGGHDGSELLDVIEDDTGSGRRWSVLEAEDGSLRAIKRGVSWPALLATLPWLLARGLLGTAIVYALLWVAALGGVAMTGLAWVDAGASASDGTKFAFTGFAAIAFAGLVLVPFLRANRWRMRKLLRRGWELAGELRAGSADEALGRFRELDVGRH